MLLIKELDNIEVITLFVRDLAAARSFYEAIFHADLVYQDDVCAVMKFGGLLVNILNVTESPSLLAPMSVGESSGGARFMFTIKVTDVDAVCRELTRHEVALLNGPVNRPWGRRTAAFVDPDGFVWEVAQVLAS